MFGAKKTADTSVYAHSVGGSTVNYTAPRQIYVNIPLPVEHLDARRYAKGQYVPKTVYCSNQIRTSKYTIFTFLPKNLFEQFRRVANTFFLLLVILQAFPEYETVPIGVAAMPIIVIVSMTAIKDGFEDYKRWVSDKTVNERTSLVLRGSWRNLNYRSQASKTFLQKVVRWTQKLLRRSVKTQRRAPDDALAVITTSNGAAPEWHETAWNQIQVGDILKLKNDQSIPADVVVLATSETDCICYLETKNLDGETSLKLRQGSMDTAWATEPADYASNKMKMIVESEPPGTHMLRYQALVTLFGESAGPSSDVGKTQRTFTMPPSAAFMSAAVEEHHIPSPSLLMSQLSTKKIPVDVNGVLFRGAVIRNTEWVIGVVVFTGDDTKQIMNSGKTPSKQSKVDRLMNPHVTVNLLFMVALCTVCGFGLPLWFGSFNQSKTPFLTGLTIRDSLAWEGFVNFWAALILFQNIVPISLYISIEIVKTAQAFFIHEDLDMYYAENDTRCLPRSWNLSDNLGQIEYIFSDKTGTLTKNIMEFKKCSIGGRVYDGKDRDFPSQDSALNSPTTARNNSTLSRKHHPQQSMFSFTVVESPQPKADDDIVYPESPKSLANHSMNKSWDKIDLQDSSEGGWQDSNLDRYLSDPERMTTTHGEIVRTFFTLLSLCHTVLADEHKDADGGVLSGPKTISYKAQSPDEACLVTVAAETGFVFKGRLHNLESGKNEMILDILGVEQKYELLNILEFDSDRKRMSVIVRPVSLNADGSKQDVIIFCKGADNIIMERLEAGQDAECRRTLRHLGAFAGEGLRTLCLAYRKLPSAFFDGWAGRCTDAMATIYSDASSRNKALDLLNNEVETHLTLLGATAIEDKLQDGVPECITTLAEAGIKIWVLTGDKVETAINVGFLCGLLKNVDTSEESGVDPNAEMVLIQIKDVISVEEIGRQLNNALTRFWGTDAVKITQRQEYALIIDGLSLKFALESEEMKALLLDVGCRCKAVICCRVSPLQKAKVVDLVKKGKKVMTLAIGDGANDVSMIQAADVGVGINGEEGLQAAMSADYAIAQFRFLSRLLLVHGRWSYARISNMILNFYLKSIVFTMVLFWYQFYSGYSAAVIYDFTYLLFYNLVFTSLPIMVLAIFDQSLSDKLCLSLPQVYFSQGIKQTMYTDRRFAWYLGESIWHSMVCFFVPYFTYFDTLLYDGTVSPGLYIGSAMAFSAILCVNLSVALDTKSWTWMSHVSIWGSCLIFAVYTVLYSRIPSTDLNGTISELGSDPAFWLTTILSVLLSLGPRFTNYYIQRMYFYTDNMIAEEMQYEINAGRMPLAGIKKPKQCTLARTKNEIIEKPHFQVPPPISTDFSLRRTPSNASSRSIAYSMSNGAASTPSGFSFSGTKGMASVILKSPLSLLSSKTFTGFSPHRESRRARGHKFDGPLTTVHEKSGKLSRKNSKIPGSPLNQMSTAATSDIIALSHGNVAEHSEISAISTAESSEHGKSSKDTTVTEADGSLKVDATLENNKSV